MTPKKLKKPKKVLFLLERHNRNALREIAFRRGISMGAALREAVHSWLKHQKTLYEKEGKQWDLRR
jgi:hypothetical protein